MKNKTKNLQLLLTTLLSILSTISFSQDTTLIKNFITKTDISGQWFLAYNYNISQNFNQFMLKRGYFTIKTDLSDNISVRYTQDIALDKEGSDAGNVEIRLKYLYMNFQGHQNTIFKNSHLEFGLVHRPWIDFEQKINRYRVQEKMFSEKYNAFNSADFGLTIGGNFGGEIDDASKNVLGKSYPGKFGSYSIGVYNGGGYHAIEYNNNKTIEARLTLRPFPHSIPGLQLTHVTAFGKSNSQTISTDFNVHLFYLSSQSQYHTLGLQYFFGKGNFNGEYVNPQYKPIPNSGLSAFAEIFIPKTEFSLFSRYDYFNIDETLPEKQESYSGGITYHFLKNKIVLFYQTDFYTGYRDNFVEFVLEIKF